MNILEALFSAIETERGTAAADAARAYAAEPKSYPDWDTDYEAIWIAKHGEIPWRYETGWDPRGR